MTFAPLAYAVTRLGSGRTEAASIDSRLAANFSERKGVTAIFKQKRAMRSCTPAQAETLYRHIGQCMPCRVFLSLKEPRQRLV